MIRELKSPKQILLVLLMIVVLVIITSCESYKYEPSTVDRNAIWHLSTEIQPIFTSSCVSCHGGSLAPDLREGKSFLSLTRGGYVDLPAEESKLYSTMTDGGHIPRSTDVEKLKVLYWIEQGAEDN